jgi:predicted small lipoprotein YifL
MTRLLAALAALLALGPVACGKYGPPQRATPQVEKVAPPEPPPGKDQEKPKP